MPVNRYPEQTAQKYLAVLYSQRTTHQMVHLQEARIPLAQLLPDLDTISFTHITALGESIPVSLFRLLGRRLLGTTCDWLALEIIRSISCIICLTISAKADAAQKTLPNSSNSLQFA